MSTRSSRAARAALAAALLALAAAAPASAAHDRTVALGPDAAGFSWSGAPATASNFLLFDSDDPAASCGKTPIDHCDQTLVRLTGTGTLDVQLPDAGDGITNDWDLYVYTAGADGTPGTKVGESLAVGESEGVYLSLASGDYLVVAVPFQAIDGGYSGSVRFTPATPR